MIKQGDKIVNPRTGQIMIFKTTGKESNGVLLEIESFNPVSNEREPIHIHPKQESSIEVLSGILHVLVDGKEHILKSNQKIVVSAGIPHCFWNEGLEEAHHLGTFSPALNIAEFFDSFFALARDGKLSKKGIPNMFQTSVMGLAYKDAIRLTNPPWFLQVLLYRMLAPIGKLFGYSDHYESKKSNS
ncbi:MAG TPA: cupin domain-containing protein [Chitinophagaceae bacterium]|jgi:quercetin dioxygenase-like cupin family protein|nr:cupin domain-containing protein [Chitinophagaceae bacterium]